MQLLYIYTCWVLQKVTLALVIDAITWTDDFIQQMSRYKIHPALINKIAVFWRDQDFDTDGI